MKRFVFLHYGFEKPTKEIMEAWEQWFASIKGNTVEQGSHFVAGKEITKNGTKKLPLDSEAITGYTIIEAKDINEAEKIAKSCPFITGIRVYETKSE